MKTLIIFLFFSILISGCKFKPDNSMHDAAIYISGVFITDTTLSNPSFRIKGPTYVKNEKDSTYHVTGTVEGFTSFNVPIDVKNFTETVRYSGGNLNDSKNWECIELYIGNKKMK